MPDDKDDDDAHTDTDEHSDEDDDDEAGDDQNTGDDDSDDDSDDEDNDGEGDGSGLSDDDLARVAEAAAEAATKVADRRINQILKNARRGGSGDDDDGDGKGRTDDRAAERYIRTAVRDEVSSLDLDDGARGLVREFSMDMVGVADLSDIDDEDQFAVTIVQSAAEMVEKAQKLKGRQLRKTKQRGNGDGKPTQATKKPAGTSKDDAMTRYEAGVEKAKKQYEID